MKFAPILFLTACATVAVAADDITTLTGKTFTNANVSRIDVDGITVLYSGGGSKIAFTNLPPDIQKKYGYDPEKAAADAAKKEKIKKLGRLGMVYRLSELEEAKAEAKKLCQPIAFLASDPKSLVSNSDPRRKGTASATVHAFEVIRRGSVIVFSDYTTENHTEPSIVDAALHPPEDVHYTAPKVVFTDPAIEKVLAVAAYADDAVERQRRLTSGLAAAVAEVKKTASPAKP